MILKGLFPCTNREFDSQNCISGCERDQIRREGKDGGLNFLCWFRDYVNCECECVYVHESVFVL